MSTQDHITNNLRLLKKKSSRPKKKNCIVKAEDKKLDVKKIKNKLFLKIINIIE